MTTITKKRFLIVAALFAAILAIYVFLSVRNRTLTFSSIFAGVEKYVADNILSLVIILILTVSYFYFKKRGM